MKVSLSYAFLLVPGLRLLLTPKRPNYADDLAYLELIYRGTWNLDVLSKSDLGFVKTNIKTVTLSSICFYNSNVYEHLSNEELEGPERLFKNNIWKQMKVIQWF